MPNCELTPLTGRATAANPANSAGSEKPRLSSRHIHAKMFICQSRRHSAPWSAIQKPNLYQKRLVHFFKRVFFLCQSRCQRSQSNRSAVILLHNRQHEPPIDLIESMRIHFQQR